MHVAHSSQRFHQRAERQARYRGYDILMQRRDLCWMVTMKPTRPELPVFQRTHSERRHSLNAKPSPKRDGVWSAH
jgi:hypothetical protein